MAWLEAYVRAAREIAREADELAAHLQNRLDSRVVNVHAYAWPTFEAFLRRHYADGRRRILALSMNPGRNGAVQTGIAFTDAATARRALPEFDRLEARPSQLKSERPEASGRKLEAWAVARYGSLEALYQRVLFAIACPVAALRGDGLNNLPLASMSGQARLWADAFYERAAPRLVRAAAPAGLWILGDYAARRWQKCCATNPTLGSIPARVTHHPAAHITNRRKFNGWTRSFEALPPPNESPGAYR